MKLAISNIAWTAEEDEQVYAMMRRYGYTGLEIAPTRFFETNPYEDLDAVRRWRAEGSVCDPVDAVHLVWEDGEAVCG